MPKRNNLAYKGLITTLEARVKRLTQRRNANTIESSRIEAIIQSLNGFIATAQAGLSGDTTVPSATKLKQDVVNNTKCIDERYEAALAIIKFSQQTGIDMIESWDGSEANSSKARKSKQFPAARGKKRILGRRKASAKSASKKHTISEDAARKPGVTLTAPPRRSPRKHPRIHYYSKIWLEGFVP